MDNRVVYVDSGGKRRKGKVALCQHCGVEFVTRVNWNTKYCSVKCRGFGQRKRVAVVCAMCDAEFEKTPSKAGLPRHGFHFCSRKCKDRAQRVGGIKEIRPGHYRDGRHYYRDKFTQEELVCHRCGYSEFGGSVYIHHIDRDRTNSDRGNLIPLCANCHHALHSGKWELELGSGAVGIANSLAPNESEFDSHTLHYEKER